MTRWGMVIDLQKCIGCDGCTAICKDANHTPPGASWRQVFTYRNGEEFSTPGVSLPMNCMHCSEPPCLEVCPTTATFRRPDGIVDVDYDICIGCGYCVVACPYLARFMTKNEQFSDPGTDEGLLNGRGNSQKGVATKCDFCRPRIEAGIEQGLAIGVAPEATPTCVAYCSGKALYFGDLEDPDSNVAKLICENETVRLQEGLGTDPYIHYVVGKTAKELPDEAEVELVPPRRQKVWHLPALINFFLGGMATGLYLLDLAIPVIEFGWLAPLLAALGFASLALEAGRPFRVHHIFRHLGQSWMSREALAGVIFILATLVDWLLPHPLLKLLAGGGAAALMVSQGVMLYRARAVTAWNKPLIPLMFVTSGFASGGGLALLLVSGGSGGNGRALALATSAWTVLNLVLWLIYLYRPEEEAFQRATQPLRRPAFALTIVVAHLLAAGLLLWSDSGLGVVVVAGLAVIGGTAVQKAGLMLRAGYLRGIRMRRPQSMAANGKVATSMSPDAIPLRVVK